MFDSVVVFISSFILSVIAIQLHRGSLSMAKMVQVFWPNVSEQSSSIPVKTKRNAGRPMSPPKPKLVRGGIKTPWGW